MILYQEDNSRGNYTYNIYIYNNKCNWVPHFHKNFEFLYVIDGKFEVTVNGQTQLMKENDFAIIFPNQVHAFHTPEKVTVWIGVFSEDFIKEFARVTEGKEGNSLLFCCSEDETAFLKKHFLTMDKKDILSLKSFLYMICSRYLQEISLKESPRQNSDMAHKIIEYIEENFRDEITLMDVAQSLGYEYHYFSRCFKNIFHTNFKTFLNQYRYDYAKDLILNTDASLSSIAYESGFGSLRNFNRIYKQFSNSTPGQRRFEQSKF